MKRILALAGLLAVAAAAVWWHWHAPRIADRPAELEGRPPVLQGDGDIVVIVDGASVAVAPAEVASPFGTPYAWLNTVFQEYGPAGALPARSVSAANLVGRRAVIVPGAVMGSLLPDGWTALREFANAGGVVLVEAGTKWPEALGAFDAHAAAPVPAGAESSAALRALAPTLQHLWSADPVQAWPPRALAYGRGALVRVSVPFARTLVDLQQGRPPHPAPAPGGWETPPAMVTPVQFQVDPALKRLRIPAADGLEHDVGVALMEAGPLPRLWTVPMGARGAFLLTVDTEFMGDASLWLAEAGAERSDPYSYFLMDSAFTARGLARLDSLGVDQGLHWDRTVSSWRPVRLLRLRLYRRQRSAEEQLRGLESKGFTPGPFGLTNRNHFLAMRDPTEHFRQMAALGVRLDASWGPDTTCFGYPYATGYPYVPIDRNGLPFAFLELPFQYADNYGGVDSAAVRALIRGCAEDAHGTLVALYHPSMLRGRGSVECYATWRRASTWARAAGLWLGQVSELGRFCGHRMSARMASTWSDPRLEITVTVKDSMQSLVLPLRWKGRALARLNRDTTSVRWREERRFGEAVGLVVLPDGSSTWTAEYRSTR